MPFVTYLTNWIYFLWRIWFFFHNFINSLLIDRRHKLLLTNASIMPYTGFPSKFPTFQSASSAESPPIFVFEIFLQRICKNSKSLGAVNSKVQKPHPPPSSERGRGTLSFQEWVW